jgi:hypothetical protein
MPLRLLVRLLAGRGSATATDIYLSVTRPYLALERLEEIEA